MRVKIFLRKYITMLKNTIMPYSKKLSLLLKSFPEFMKIRYRWLIFALAILILLEFFILSKFPQMPKNSNAELYLLSAISQSLAAIFAIVFTITLVILRISYHFRGLLREFFMDAFNIFYLILSSIVIVVPFWILRIEVTVLGLNICLVLASTCVLLTLPFFLRMKNFLEINVGIRQLLQTTREDIQRKDINEYQNKLEDIRDLIEYGLEEHQYHIIPLTLKGYITLCKKCHIYFGMRKYGVSGTIENLFVVTIMISCYRNGLNKMENELYDIAALPRSIKALDQLDIIHLFHIFSTITSSETAVKQHIRFIACCCVWILSVYWLKVNSKRESYVKDFLVTLMKTTNQQFVIDCCNKIDTIMSEKWSGTFRLADDEKVILERLRIWATEVNIEESNKTNQGSK